MFPQSHLQMFAQRGRASELLQVARRSSAESRPTSWSAVQEIVLAQLYHSLRQEGAKGERGEPMTASVHLPTALRSSAAVAEWLPTKV